MKRISRILATVMTTGLLALAVAVPAFAAPADAGLSIAVGGIVDSGLAGEEHPANSGTHHASCTVTEENPATDLEDPNC